MPSQSQQKIQSNCQNEQLLPSNFQTLKVGPPKQTTEFPVKSMDLADTDNYQVAWSVLVFCNKKKLFIHVGWEELWGNLSFELKSLASEKPVCLKG